MHFIVAVFTNDEGQSVDNLLSPYYEGLTVAPYVELTKAQLIQREKERTRLAFEGAYAEWNKDPAKYEAGHHNLTHIAFLKTIPERLKWTDEQLHKYAIDGREDRVSIDGDLLSTFNPNAMWDYYAVGGRWNNMLILKDNTRCDSALVSKVDFNAIQRCDEADLVPYERAKKECYSKPEQMLERFTNEEDYIKQLTIFHTYAVITPDGQWHEPRIMGSLDTSSESAAEERKWRFSYYERFIKPAIEKGWWITIVDCHV